MGLAAVESSENLGIMWFLLPLALPALVAGQCQVNLDKVSGKHPPLLLQKSQFIFPTEKVGDERVLNFNEGDSLELFCYGGSDGKTDKLETLQKVSIGWRIEDTFIEQIGICIDERNFGTIWTNHTVRGASIALRDIDPKRPSFRADTGAYTRKNQRYNMMSQ